MTVHRHPKARAEARHLVDRYDGSAERMVEQSIEAKIEHGEVDEALELDQVRREIEQIYRIEGK